MNGFNRLSPLRHLGRAVAVSAALSFTVSPVFAQETSGDIVGTVKDSTGAVVPSAQVTITNEDTHVAVQTKAGNSGEFHATNLLPGRYDIAVTSSGFQGSTVRGVLVDINKTSTSDVTLAVGSNSTTVEVTADSGVTLDTTTTNLTTTFTNVELSQLPTASVGLGVINTSLLSPGVASSGGIGIGIGPSVGGQRPRNNNFEIEGIDNNNKSVTGPLVYVPNDAVGNFTLITNQFSPEFGHSSGGQFNTTIVSGTNKFHGKLYEYFDNRDLNAAAGVAGNKQLPRYDDNRYGGELGGPILKDKLFFFAGFERHSTGQAQSYALCVPTAAGVSLLKANAGSFSANNLSQYLNYTPTPNQNGGAQVTAANDNACFNQSAGGQFITVNGAAGAVQVPLGNYQVNSPYFTNFDALTTGVDYNISANDQLRLRYIYNTEGTTDFAATLPNFWTSTPYKYHLFALSEYHTFTPNLTNEFRVGFNRYDNTVGAGNFNYPGLDAFPNLTFYDLGAINYGPDPNAPQFTIQNLYQVTDNISYTLGKHNLKIGFDGRKYISPQGFTQRARGDYEWNNLNGFLHDTAPDNFGERSTGNATYYGDQTALYGYANDTYRMTPTVTINAGLRYEFTSVPVGEREQALNAVASVPGLISFHAPQPTYTNFAPRVGINWAPDSKTSVRAGFGMAYDVLFDNLGTLSFPPQLSQTQDVGIGNAPAAGSPNFLANGGLPPGQGAVTVLDAATARADTAAYLPNQVTPYAETYTLTVQRTIGSAYTAEIGYEGTRGIHLPTQDQINIQPKVNANNQLPTLVNGTPLTAGGSQTSTLGAIDTPNGNFLPQYLAAGFTSKITSYQPYSSSNYNALIANLTRRFQGGLQMNLSYTFSKTMDDATAEVFATVLTPRRPQNSQNVAADYSRSALDRTHRVTLEALYDLPFYKKSSNFLLKNLVGNWTISPTYTYESPEYATALSGVNSNLNGDSGAAIDRPLVNPNGVKGTATGSVPVVNAALVGSCSAAASSGPSAITATAAANGAYNVCENDTVAYSAGSLDPNTGAFTPSNAYYVQANLGTLPNAARNSLPIRPIDNVDVAAYKRLTFHDRYSLEVGAQAFNVLNHAQYIPGSIDNVNGPSYVASYSFQTVTSSAFGQAQKVFSNNPRTMQISAKLSF